jgi:phospholipase/lecithinase/hemolysin
MHSGFQEARDACCGTGTIEVAILCNADSPGTCTDASKYIFFDSFHPTSKFYEGVAQKAITQILTAFATS